MRPSLILAILLLALLLILPACGGTSAVPVTAIQVQTGRPDNAGRVLYRASDSGQIYILNQNRNEIVYSGFVRRDDPIVLDTVGDRVLINNQVVSQLPLDGGDSYEFRLDRDYPRGGTVVERRRVITETHVRD